MRRFIAHGTWSNEAPPGALIIPGVNYMLDGKTTANDFWPVGLILHDAANGTMHGTVVTTPDASSALGAFLTALMAFGSLVFMGRASMVSRK
jgi:hypothetical protein